MFIVELIYDLEISIFKALNLFSLDKILDYNRFFYLYKFGHTLF